MTLSVLWLERKFGDDGRFRGGKVIAIVIHDKKHEARHSGLLTLILALV